MLASCLAEWLKGIFDLFLRCLFLVFVYNEQLLPSRKSVKTPRLLRDPCFWPRLCRGRTFSWLKTQDFTLSTSLGTSAGRWLIFLLPGEYGLQERRQSSPFLANPSSWPLTIVYPDVQVKPAGDEAPYFRIICASFKKKKMSFLLLQLVESEEVTLQ